MKNKFKCFVTFYSLIFLLVLLSVNVRAQNKTVFTDNFSDNHNNWPVKGKKISISKETGYAIDITKSKESFTALQTIPVDSTKDFEITMKIQEKGNQVDAYYNAGFLFGAKDEKNGYALVITVAGSVEIINWIDNVPNILFKEEQKYRSDKIERTISLKSEHGRWKVGTIANIRALPFKGNKAGVYVQNHGTWQIHSFEVVEKDKEKQKEKENAGLFNDNGEFPFALFMTRFMELKCDAESNFSENVDQSGSYKHKSIPFNKSIPGFTSPTITYEDEMIELSGGKSFYDFDQAANYYDDLKAAIELSSASKCLKYLSHKDNAQIDKIFKDFLKHDYWETVSTDIMKGKMMDKTISVLQILSERTTKESNKKFYTIEFHLVDLWTEKK